MSRLFAVVGLCAAFTLACSGLEDLDLSTEDTTTIKSSCDHIQGYSECTENYTRDMVINDDTMKSICDIVDGTFRVDTPCPADNRVGGCYDSTINERDYYYSVGEMAYTVEAAQEDCAEDNGTWLPEQ